VEYVFFILTPAGSFSRAWSINRVSCCWCLEISTSSVDWAQQIRPFTLGQTSPISETFQIKIGTMDNVQKIDHCTESGF
jgi:hypothetical protein